jgi:hypothetical protein
VVPGDRLDRIDDRLVDVAVESLGHRIGRGPRALLTPRPRRTPFANGEYGVNPTPWSKHSGIISRSSSRLRPLY